MTNQNTGNFLETKHKYIENNIIQFDALINDYKDDINLYAYLEFLIAQYDSFIVNHCIYNTTNNFWYHALFNIIKLNGHGIPNTVKLLTRYTAIQPDSPLIITTKQINSDNSIDSEIQLLVDQVKRLKEIDLEKLKNDCIDSHSKASQISANLSGLRSDISTYISKIHFLINTAKDIPSTISVRKDIYVHHTYTPNNEYNTNNPYIPNNFNSYGDYVTYKSEYDNIYIGAEVDKIKDTLTELLRSTEISSNYISDQPEKINNLFCKINNLFIDIKPKLEKIQDIRCKIEESKNIIEKHLAESRLAEYKMVTDTDHPKDEKGESNIDVNNDPNDNTKFRSIGTQTDYTNYNALKYHNSCYDDFQSLKNELRNLIEQNHIILTNKINSLIGFTNNKGIIDIINSLFNLDDINPFINVNYENYLENIAKITECSKHIENTLNDIKKIKKLENNKFLNNIEINFNKCITVINAISRFNKNLENSTFQDAKEELLLPPKKTSPRPHRKFILHSCLLFVVQCITLIAFIRYINVFKINLKTNWKSTCVPFTLFELTLLSIMLIILYKYIISLISPKNKLVKLENENLDSSTLLGIKEQKDQNKNSDSSTLLGIKEQKDQNKNSDSSTLLDIKEQKDQNDERYNSTKEKLLLSQKQARKKFILYSCLLFVVQCSALIAFIRYINVFKINLKTNWKSTCVPFTLFELALLSIMLITLYINIILPKNKLVKLENDYTKTTECLTEKIKELYECELRKHQEEALLKVDINQLYTIISNNPQYSLNKVQINKSYYIEENSITSPD